MDGERWQRLTRTRNACSADKVDRPLLLRISSVDGYEDMLTVGVRGERAAGTARTFAALHTVHALAPRTTGVLGLCVECDNGSVKKRTRRTTALADHSRVAAPLQLLPAQ